MKHKPRWKRANLFEIVFKKNEDDLNAVERKIRKHYESMNLMERIKLQYFIVGEDFRVRATR